MECGVSEFHMIKLLSIISVAIAAGLVGGCMTAQEHRAAVTNTEGERVTVGTVQREIRVGMSGAEVAKSLGSPNIVSTDENGNEVWIYDKISTTRVYSESKGGISALILGGGIIGGAIAGAAGVPSYNESAGASSTQQRTLTVIVKFNKSKKVRDFAYHTSRF